LDTWGKIKNNPSMIKERTFEDDLNDLFIQERNELLHNNQSINSEDTDDSSISENYCHKIIKSKCEK
jgi:hypothetical protein